MTCKIANGERLAKKVTTASGDKMYYFHPDHLGSTSIVSDESGNLVEKTEYYPYGGVKQGGGEQYLFTGKELDKGTGLYYYGARYYSPELMRFTQPDSIIPDAYDPQSLNRYAYVRNNPLKYVDPSGNRPLDRVNLNLIHNKSGDYAGVNSIYGPGLQPLSRQEYYVRERRNIKWRWVSATINLGMAVGYVRGKSAAKLERIVKGAETTNEIYDISQINNEAEYYKAVWLASKFMKNDDEFEGFLGLLEEEFPEFATIKSHPTYLRDFNPHDSGSSGGWGGSRGWYRDSTSPSGSTGDYGHESQNTGARYDYDRGKIVRLN